MQITMIVSVLSINQSINQSISQSIDQSINQSIKQFVNVSKVKQLRVKPSTNWGHLKVKIKELFTALKSL